MQDIKAEYLKTIRRTGHRLVFTKNSRNNVPIPIGLKKKLVRDLGLGVRYIDDIGTYGTYNL